MHHSYDDIRSRIPMEPLWWDENAVPRYVDFHPHHLANIYATEALLLRIACQGCGRIFLVALSDDGGLREERAITLAGLVRGNEVHFGDPPNIDCCPSGPTMNSVPRDVIEFWSRVPGREWQRCSELERRVYCDWATDPEPPSDMGAR